MRTDGDSATQGLEALFEVLRLAGPRAEAPPVDPAPDEAVAATGPEQARLVALVDRARAGDADAFGDLYDHYRPQVHHFLLARTRSAPVAEDLTSETFLRALRRVRTFRWQGRDFGAWLMTIARNLLTDHQGAASSRLEVVQDDMTHHDTPAEGPEHEVIAAATSALLLRALADLPREQRTCLELRFLEGRTIAGTARVLARSEGAVKQLQRRAVLNLARRMPADLRD